MSDDIKLVGFRLRLAFEDLAAGMRQFFAAHQQAYDDELDKMRAQRKRVAEAAAVREAEYQQWKRKQVPR